MRETLDESELQLQLIRFPVIGIVSSSGALNQANVFIDSRTNVMTLEKVNDSSLQLMDCSWRRCRRWK